MWGWIFIISFFGVLIGFGQTMAGKLWGKILYYASTFTLGLSIGKLLIDWSRSRG